MLIPVQEQTFAKSILMLPSGQHTVSCSFYGVAMWNEGIQEAKAT